MNLQINDNISLAEQLVSHFTKNNFNLIDLRKELDEAKDSNQLYQKFDTHWNSFGAFIAYQSFCEKSFQQLQIKPFKLSDFDVSYKKVRKGDLVYMLGMSEFPYAEDEIPEFSLIDQSKNYKTIQVDSLPERTVVTVNKNCNNEKVALIFRDSYSKHLIQFFSLHYSKVIYIYCTDVEYYDQQIVDKVQPDVVIAFSVERYLHLLML